ncbi:protein HOMOLOG OF MAMMALIAN LYST-INTERACTING PROTEIN 5 isoform X2 [Impatiens glandulifera]|uniref:protein HOMOLOG OF MAMMALIAN LYST-INTERACTING PROTEIN 5 isoform X2 n=1 Tax=Impatiens glandulifera TaxID=253017 RepID=UPI001FB0C9F3|nr:protein HOMOLOG OF MAMMALIAN LYST-INTERACTING PROTEIN 5 isoform X2 [Impatiens glandulifera]
MVNDNEPAKLLLPYLQRADELQKHEPLVAYYCRLYAMERGLKIPQNERTKTTNQILISIMNQLEKDKKSLTLNPDDQLHLEGFALGVFSKADKQDRAGRSDLNTAKTFYAASIFFEVLTQFGELQPDIEQKQKYATWKAADIRKALKEGRKPVPGAPGDGDDDDEGNLSLPSIPPPTEHDRQPGRKDSDIRPQSPDVYDGENPFSNANVPSKPSSSENHQSPFTNDLSPHSPYHSQDYHHSPPSNLPPSNLHDNNSSYSPHPYHHQQHPQNYPSQEAPPPPNYPNFQSYPSFNEPTLPPASTHYASYYQGSEPSYTSPPTAPTVTNYQVNPQYSSSNNGSGPASIAKPTIAQTYEYDSNYQPPPDKIAEAHKAARFAVGALAFDDVFVAVDHLKKALELLTNPSATH